MNKLKFDTNILLKLALDELKTNRRDFERKYWQRLKVADRDLMLTQDITSTRTNPQTGLPLFRREFIWSTPRATIKTTQHGRILDIEWRRVAQEQAPPTVTVKRRRRV
jgi:hypothetical protein